MVDNAQIPEAIISAETGKLQPPPKPLGTFFTTLIGGGIGLVIGAAIALAGYMTFGGKGKAVATAVVEESTGFIGALKQAVIDAPGIGVTAGAAAGLATGLANNATHPIAVDNVALRNENAQFKKDNAALKSIAENAIKAEHSHAQQIAEQKLQAEQAKLESASAGR